MITKAAPIRVPLVGGRHALIDRADGDLVRQYRWYCLPTPTGRFYATTEVDGRMVYMHRLIAATPDGMTTDHVNNDGLDNRRSNLRCATWTQNIANVAKIPTRRGRPTSSRYKGVSWDKSRRRWAASAKIGDLHKHLGRYDSEEQAARAYDAAVYEAHGEFAYLNFPDRIGEPTPHRPGRRKTLGRTHCPQEHEYTPENSRINSAGYRVCITCSRQKDRDRWRRRRDQSLLEAGAA